MLNNLEKISNVLKLEILNFFKIWLYAFYSSSKKDG